MTFPDNPPLVALPRGRRRATIDDVAREAGVSVSTVSRVMNGKNWVSESTRQAVVDAMKNTGFVANATARSLATRRTGSIALVLGAPATQLFEDPNYALVLQVLTEELATFDYSLLFMSAATPPDRARLARFLRGGHVDGVVFLSAEEPRADDLVELLTAHPIPVLVYGRPFPDSDPLPHVACDEISGGAIMAAHLLGRGFRRIGIIATHLDAIGPRERAESFRDAVGDRAHPDGFIVADDFSHAAGRESMRRLLERCTDLDAVFAVSDVLAAGAIDAIHEAGLRVPEDIAVAGFDDSVIATRTTPQLTTVRQDMSGIARIAVHEILAAVEGQPTQSRTLPVELVVRESA